MSHLSRQQAKQGVDHDGAKQAESEQPRERIGAKQLQHGELMCNRDTNQQRRVLVRSIRIGSDVERSTCARAPFFAPNPDVSMERWTCSWYRPRLRVGTEQVATQCWQLDAY